MKSGIYGIHNLINDKWYVGQSVDIHARWNAHRSLLSRGERDSLHLLRAWQKYGAAAFEWVVLEECSLEMLDEREIYWITQKDSYRNGYNRTIGGSGNHGFHLSAEHKEMLRERTTAAWSNADQRKKRLEAMRSAMNTDEYKRKQAAASRRNWSDPNFKNESLRKMKEGMTDEARIKRRESIKRGLSKQSAKEKLSKASKENWASEEYRRKMAEARSIYMDDDYRERARLQSKTRWQSVDYQELVKKNLSEAKRESAPAIIQVETGKVYRNTIDAAEELQINRSHIVSVCNGHRKKAGGFHWRYADEDQQEWEKRRKKYVAANSIKEFPKVICIETGEVYDQPKLAAEAVGVHPSNITKVCSGEQLSAGGYHWKYLDETNEQREKRIALAKKIESKTKTNQNCIHVRCVETGVIYESVRSAAESLNINRSGISNALRGASKTAGGFHWEYLK